VNRPLLVDLFCCGGGASSGYAGAGFDVLGVDTEPHKSYPFRFVQMDALEFIERQLSAKVGYPVIAWHASPPCQRYSGMSVCRPGLADEYPNLIGPVRELLIQTGQPYVIENVMGARDELRDPVTLCMDFFGIPDVSKDRLFETSFPLDVPEHGAHKLPRLKAGRWEPGYALSPVGHFPQVSRVRELLGVPWMTRDEIAECLPPAYTDFIGGQLLEQVGYELAA
jgi:DNA (cytosine-5)-methyltransferase 1